MSMLRHEPPPQPAQPSGAEPPGWLDERLFEQRIVLLSGQVTGASASRVAATLLTLDALGDDPVHMQISAPDADLSAAFALIDTIDVMRSPVHAIATAEVGGAAVGVYAAAGRRVAFPHARFRLAEPKVTGIAGTADEVAAAAGRHLQALEDLVLRIAAACNQPRSRVEDDLAAGRLLSAEQAKEYGLVEAIGPA
jgi:ATP-dependent Clp protease, protease subunit